MKLIDKRFMIVGKSSFIWIPFPQEEKSCQ